MWRIIKNSVSYSKSWFKRILTSVVSVQKKLPHVNLPEDSDEEIEIFYLDSDNEWDSKKVEGNDYNIRLETSRVLSDEVGDKVVATWFADEGSEDDNYGIDVWNDAYNKWNNAKIEEWLEKAEEVEYEEKGESITVSEMKQANALQIIERNINAAARKTSISLGVKNLWLNLTKENYEIIKNGHGPHNKCCVYVKLFNGDTYRVTVYNNNKFENDGEFLALRICFMTQDTPWTSYSTLPEIREILGLSEKGDCVYVDKVFKKDPVMSEVLFNENFNISHKDQRLKEYSKPTSHLSQKFEEIFFEKVLNSLTTEEIEIDEYKKRQQQLIGDFYKKFSKNINVSETPTIEGKSQMVTLKRTRDSQETERVTRCRLARDEIGSELKNATISTQDLSSREF